MGPMVLPCSVPMVMLSGLERMFPTLHLVCLSERKFAIHLVSVLVVCDVCI